MRESGHKIRTIKHLSTLSSIPQDGSTTITHSTSHYDTALSSTVYRTNNHSGNLFCHWLNMQPSNVYYKNKYEFVGLKLYKLGTSPQIDFQT